MLDPGWVFVSAVLGLTGDAWYAVATWRGRARPNLVTWSLWAVVPLIAFSAQLDAGVGSPAVLTLAAGLGPLVVVVTGLARRHRSYRIQRFDVVCGTVATVAVGAWLGLHDASLAVLLAVAAKPGVTRSPRTGSSTR